MPRDEIEDLLRNEGDYLVRSSDVNGVQRFILSVCWKGRVRHMVVGLSSKLEWSFCKDIGFKTIDELLAHYANSKYVLQKDGTTIKTPIPRPDWYILHESLKLKKKIGNGSFGDVFVAEYIKEEKEGKRETVEVAVKMLKGEMGKKERATFMKEASINRKFSHPNVVKLMGVAVEMAPVMVVLEVVPNGSLKGYVSSNSFITPHDLAG